MINAAQLRTLVVRPALEQVGMWSEAAENLVMGTAAAESRLHYLAQLGGPALGLWQMEPATHSDIWRNYLDYRKPLGHQVMLAAGIDGPARQPSHDLLVFNLRYAAVMCRVHYRRASEPLPSQDDVEGMAGYYKRHYNTVLGKASVEKALPFFEEACRR